MCIWGIARRLASESSIHRVSSGVFTLSSARRRPSKRTCQNRTLAGIKHAACILGSPSVVSPLKRPTRFVNGWLISSTSTHLRLSSSTLDTTRCRVRAVSLCLCVWKASRRRSAPLASSTPSTVDALPLNPLCFFSLSRVGAVLWTVGVGLLLDRIRRCCSLGYIIAPVRRTVQRRIPVVLSRMERKRRIGMSKSRVRLSIQRPSRCCMSLLRRYHRHRRSHHAGNVSRPGETIVHKKAGSRDGIGGPKQSGRSVGPGCSTTPA